MRILVAEDERDLNQLISKTLAYEGYSVDSCFDGNEAWDYIKAAEYDVVVLDIMMPVMDGLSVLRNMREQKMTTPVLLLTAKDSVEDRVTGLDSGADDYLIKPFSFDELLARLRVMTRHQTKQTTNVFEIANLSVDCNTHVVKRDEQVIQLSAKEFTLLEYLIRNQGIVLSRNQIENHVWNFEYEGGSNLIDVYIRYLRKKIDNGFEPKLVHTVRGVGYVLREEP